MVSSIVSNGDAEVLNGSILEFQDEPLPGLVLSSLNMMRKNVHFCDVILLVGSTEVHGHRAVLAAVSPYLFELFSADNQSNKEQRVTYKLSENIDKTALQKLIDYAYTSRLEILPSQLKSVYLAAWHLRMERVASQCTTHLVDSLTPETCLNVRALPGITQNKSFVQQVEAYIREHFTEICKSSTLTSLPCVKIEVLHQTLQEMHLVNGSTLCHLVLEWIKRLSTDLSDFNLVQMTEKTYMLYLALDNSLQDCTDLPCGDVSDTDLVQDYKKLSLKNQAQCKNRRKGAMQPAKPRVLIYSQDAADWSEQEIESEWNLIAVDKVGEHTFLAIGVLEGKLATLSVQLRLNIPTSSSINQDISKSTVIEDCSTTKPDLYCALPTMKEGKCAVGCADLNGSLLVCGGYDRVECLKSVDRYLPESNTWQAMSPMKEARGRFGIAVVRGKVYAIGGSNGTNELDTVEVLDPDNKWKWSKIASLPLARSNCGVCALDDKKIYCIGGWNGHVGIKQCDVFDPETGEWSSCEPLSVGRYQAGACAYDNKVYVVGGCDSWNCLGSVEIYDGELKKWSMGSSLILARRGCGLAPFRSKLYAVGGSTGTHSLSACEIYDPVEQTWTPGPSMAFPRANVAVAVVGGRLYAVGGFDGKSFLNSIEYLDENSNEWTAFVPKSDGIKTPINSQDGDFITNSDSDEKTKDESSEVLYESSNRGKINNGNGTCESNNG